jgi:hypothetical protein
MMKLWKLKRDPRVMKLEKMIRDQRIRVRKSSKLKDDRTWYGTPKRAAFACASTETARSHSSSSIALATASASSELARLRCGRWRLPEPGRGNCERSLTRAATQRAKIADVRSRRSRISSNTSPRTLCRSHNCQERALGPNVRQPSCSPATRRGGAKRPQVPIRAWGSFCGGKPAS